MSTIGQQANAEWRIDLMQKRIERGLLVVDRDYFQTLRRFCDACEARTVLEIGIGPEGNSAKIFASSMSKRLPAKVISIDIDTERPRPQERAEVERTGVEWQVIHGDSLKVVVDEPIDLLYVDGDHIYEYALGDFLRFAPLVRPGGYILMDDYPSFEGVAQAVAELERVGWYGLFLPYDLKNNGHVIYRKPGDIAPWVTDRNADG